MRGSSPMDAATRRMSSLGSTPTTRPAHRAHHRVDSPVPLPRSTTSAGRGSPLYAQMAAAKSSGGVGRTRPYSSANPETRSPFGGRSVAMGALLQALARRVVGEDLAAGLARRAVRNRVLRVLDGADLVPAHDARFALAAVHRTGAL